MTLKSKISSMTTIETRPFWPYSYILWKVMYRNTRYMCTILVANIIWRSGNAIRSVVFLWISPVSIVVADVSSQFPASQLCNMIVLVGRFRGTLFGRQIVLSMHEKVNKENSSGAKVD